MLNKDWLDRLLKKRFGRLAWVLGIIVVSAGFIALGVKAAVLTGPPIGSTSDYWILAIVVGIFIAFGAAIICAGVIWVFCSIVEWIWNG